MKFNILHVNKTFTLKKILQKYHHKHEAKYLKLIEIK
jgi:hypothetical protein